jgi:hypothetical protein
MERRERGAEAEGNELEEKIDYSDFRAMLINDIPYTKSCQVIWGYLHREKLGLQP